MKKKLLIVLGAGSSLDQGMPSVADIDAKMKTWSEEWFRSDFAIPPVDNFYRKLWDNAVAYCTADRWSSNIRPNFERALGDMVALAHWMEPASSGNALRPFVSGGTPPVGLDWQFDSATRPYEAYQLINTQLGFLLKQLAGFMRQLCINLDTEASSFRRYCELLTQLRQTFDVGVYNLNYDNVAIAAWPEAFTGFDPNGRFDPEKVHNKSEWNFVYHLHGSVHHAISGSFVDAIRWQPNLLAMPNDGDEGQATNILTDHRTFLRSTLIAGGFKLDQSLIEPFHSLQSAFTRHLYEADAILIGGYGFGDAHINWSLHNTAQRRLVQRPPDPVPVMILGKSIGPERGLDYRQDIWARDLRTMLSAQSFQLGFSETLRGAWDGAFVPSSSFEVSAVHKVAVWNGGFSEAVGHAGCIAAYLDSGDSELLMYK